MTTHRYAIPLLLLILTTHYAVAHENDRHELEPYFVQDVTFRSGDLTLAGLLHMPNRQPPHPAVVIIHGSGNEGFVNQYRFMSHWFASHGIATLFYYKRGTGPSEGVYTETPDRLDVLADDALAAVAFLKTQAEVNPSQIGFWGHSQGGWVAPLAASRSSDVAFVINVSGPIVEPIDQITYQRAQELVHRRGYTEEEGEAALELIRAAYRYWHSGDGYAEAAATYQHHAGANWLKDMGWPTTLPPVDSLGENSRAFFGKPSLSFNPRPYYTSLRIPLLVVYGADDWFIPVEESIDALQGAIRDNPNKDITLKVFENSGHAIAQSGDGGRVFYASGYPEYLIEWLATRLDVQVNRRAD